MGTTTGNLYRVDRGFTLHEMLDEVGLIHMNGRVYEPALGRFMSADPMVTYPSRATSFNRYAYAMDNPLRFVDPTGWDPREARDNTANFDKSVSPSDQGADKDNQSASSKSSESTAIPKNEKIKDEGLTHEQLVEKYERTVTLSEALREIAGERQSRAK